MLIDWIVSYFNDVPKVKKKEETSVGRDLYTSAIFDKSEFVYASVDQMKSINTSDSVPVYKSGDVILFRNNSISQDLVRKAGFQGKTQWELLPDGFSVTASVRDGKEEVVYRRQSRNGKDEYHYERVESGVKQTSMKKDTPFRTDNESEVLRLAGEYLLGRNIKVHSLYKADPAPVMDRVWFHQDASKVPYCGDIDPCDAYEVLKLVQAYIVDGSQPASVGLMLSNETNTNRRHEAKWTKIQAHVEEHSRLSPDLIHKALFLADMTYLGKNMHFYMTGFSQDQVKQVVDLYKVHYIMSA